MTLRPHVAQAGAYVRDVAPLAAGGYALLTKHGIQLLDERLALRGAIEGDSESQLVVLSGERFLVHGTRMSFLYEGKLGGKLEKVDLGESLVYSVAATASGFHAFTTEHVLVEHAGARTVVAPERKCKHGGDAWRGGSVVAGYDGLAILAADGSLVAEANASLWARPVAFGSGIAVQGRNEVIVFDGEARELGRVPYKVEVDALLPFQGGLLTSRTDEDATQMDLAYWEVEGGELVERWWIELEGHMKPPVPVGDRIAIASYKSGLLILDAAGSEVAAVPTSKIVDDIAAFAGGIAFTVRDSPDVSWWRPEAVEPLGHDASPDMLRAVPAGVMTSEGNVLFLWRTDEQGPAWTPIESPLPMNQPIVLGAGIVTITGGGRFALRGTTLGGHPCRIPPDATWRPVTTRDEATRILERLIARTFDGPLPALSDEVLIDEVARKLARLPLRDTVDLFGKTLFAASSLDERTREYASFARRYFFDELGYALGTTGRVLLAAVKARKLRLEPPRPIADYEYLGTFTTSGDLTVSDPCQIGKKSNPAFPLALKVQGLPGVWHAFVRGGAGSDRDRNAEFVAIHDDGFDVHANEPIGSIGIDSGTAGVFDKKCPKRDDSAVLDEGTFAALGAVVSTGYGDGFYPVLAGKAKGSVAKIRIHFIGDDIETDRSMPKSTAQARPYSASQKFAMGDTIEHVKFGTGSVVRVGGDGKIDVRFPDGTRTLVHAKK